MMSLVGGVVIAMIFCWQEGLACLGLAPLLMVGKKLHIRIVYGLSKDLNEKQKEANLLCGDAITNFKTVQSFGHEDLISKKYESYLAPSQAMVIKEQLKAGLAFGFNNFLTYMVMAMMFFLGGKIMQAYIYTDADTGEIIMGINPENVFIALFAMMFGASHAGTAAAFGPDMGKALAACERVFRMKDAPSSINAVEMNKDVTKVRLDYENVLGKIVFKDVWFRYPTRKEDFVLKGLTITINPNE
jgi:ATP-binding cassette subfamily B (MDR/TAP) protein 1